jgi:arylsulfatase A-like enzyme
MRFTDAHSPSAVCTPTRYGLLTGRYAWRTRLKSGVLWGEGDPLIEHGRPTLLSMLHGRGYHTAGIGKWHLGLGWQPRPGETPSTRTQNQVEWIDYSKPVSDGPTHHGFDLFFGIPASLDMPPYVYLRGNSVERIPSERLPGIPEGDPGFYRPGPASPGFHPQHVLADLTREATSFIRDRAARPTGRPFVLYFALASPHTPVLPTGDFQGATGIGVYGDFVAQTDSAVGELLRTLDATGLAGDTLVLFTSDNGPAPLGGIAEAKAHGHDASGGWRGTKFDIYEGGHRVPFVVRWPGHVPAGTTSTLPIGLQDIFASVAEAIGEPLPASSAEDSISFAPSLRAPSITRRTEGLVHHSQLGAFAIRHGKWKLCLTPGSGGQSAPRPGTDEERGLPLMQLYDLDADPRETRNLIGEHPDIAERLQAMLKQYEVTGRTR